MQPTCTKVCVNRTTTNGCSRSFPVGLVVSHITGTVTACPHREVGDAKTILENARHNLACAEERLDAAESAGRRDCTALQAEVDNWMHRVRGLELEVGNVKN